jgi:hypothetical protein
MIDDIPHMTAADQVRETQIDNIWHRMINAVSKENAEACFEIFVVLVRTRSDQQILRLEMQRRTSVE